MRPFSKRVTLLLITSLATKSSHVCTSFVLATPTEPTSRDSSLSQNFPSDGVRMSARKSNVLSLRMTEPAEVDSLEYTPDKVWKYVQQGGKFGSTNKPTAGPQVEKALPKGKHALQLHSLGTPNGVKVTSLLEELNLKYGTEYDAYTVNIFDGDQFASGFVDANPNSKIPALLHYKDGLNKPPVRVFETSAIMIYLCETFDTENVFYPKIGDPKRAECLSWVMFTQGSAPFLGGGFGHFYAYAPEKYQYPIDRYTMEVKRQLDVLDRHLGGVSQGGGGPFLCGDQMTIADLACWPWYGNLVLGTLYDAAEFLNVKEYTHVMAWAQMMSTRTGVDRGRKVNRTWGPESDQLLERHSAQDFVDLEERTKTKDQ